MEMMYCRCYKDTGQAQLNGVYKKLWFRKKTLLERTEKQQQQQQQNQFVNPSKYLYSESSFPILVE